MGAFESSPRERAASALRTAIRKAATDACGAEIVYKPIEGRTFTRRERLDDPLAGVRAARLARDVAIGELRSYAEQARGAGRSWDDIAGALDIEPGQDGEPRDEQAYRLIVDRRPLPTDADPGWCWRSVSHWRCESCGQRITDGGPFEVHPDDAEDGHAAGCRRHAVALDKYHLES